MNKRILISLTVIGAVAAIAVGGTIAYFSDTETSTGNTFTAGTIDIAIDQQNPWAGNYSVGDLKPGETGNINFVITNEGTNPVNVSKNVGNFQESTGLAGYDCPEGGDYEGGVVSSEPECVEAQANGSDLDDIQSMIVYDLSVEVYDAAGVNIWWQAIYTDDEGQTLSSVYPNTETYVALGMIPVGGYMKVTQSYHFDYDAGNEYQGDELSFDITIKGEQMTQESGYTSVVLENKTGPTEWDIIQDGISGTLSYQNQGPLFVYNFSGVAPLLDHDYVLAVGYDENTDVDTQIGIGSTDGDGNIAISGSFDTGSLTNAKAWLVPAENWTGGMVWTDWPASAANFLWETGLINYVKN